MIYIIIETLEYKKYYGNIADGLAIDGNYYILRFDDSDNIPTELNDKIKFDKASIKTQIVKIRNGETVDTNKDKELRDISGRLEVSTAIVPKGWTFHAPIFRFQTSTAGSIDFKDKFGNDMSSMVTLGFFKTQTEYLTFQQCTPAEATFTVATFTPPYDYYIMSGSMRQKSTPTQPVALYATLAPFVPYEQGGAREFICCSDLRFRVNGDVEADGKSPKYVPYIQVNETPPLYANSIELFIRHDAGFQHEIEIEIGLYRL